MRIPPVVAFATLMALLAPCIGSACAQQSPASPAGRVVSTGTFTDRDGQKHTWQVLPEHTLIWDGVPYIPVGGTFAPRSFLEDSEVAWEADTRALATLRERDLRDILIWPEQPLPGIPAERIQRLIDHLEAHGFRYGLAFGPGLTLPLTGFVVRPAYYRHENQDSLSASWHVGAETGAGLFTLVDVSSENRLLRGGLVQAREGVITVPTEPPAGAGRVVANLYPRKSLPPGDHGSLPNIWQGFDDYRDRLLHTLSAVKFGKGLRFFLDPLARHLGLSGESDFLIPDSEDFRLEFEGYLARNHPNVEELKLAWGVTEGDFRTHQQLARLIPLWANDRGIPYFYDVVTNRTYRVLNPLQSRWWRDYLSCRNESIRYAMHALAVTLKRQVAEVPVVYTWTQSHPIFLAPASEEGYDGLGIVVRASGQVLLSRTLGPAYSQSEQSGRTLWCVATQIRGEGQSSTGQNTPPDNASAGGYATRAELFATLEGLRRLGFKGFFAESLQANPTDRSQGVTEWLSSPERLEWLKEYAGRIEREPGAGRYAPAVLFFPQSAPGPARIGPVPGTNNVFWLSAFADGEALDWWPSYSGYVLRRGEGAAETVLVSLQGPRKTHLLVPDPRQVRAFTPEYAEIPLRIQGKNTIEITLSATPTIFRTGGQKLVPREAAEDVILQLGALLQQATAQKLPAIDADRIALDRAVSDYRRGDYESAYTFARSSLDNLTYLAAPYIWLEGEYPYQRVHTFNEVAPHVEASGGAYLRLSTPHPPSRLGYAARYVFDVPFDGKYTVWLAGTVPGPNTSPIRWRINTEPERTIANPTPQGPLYLGERFGWYQLGTVNLQKGPQQSLTIYVTDRATTPPEYIFSIDAILITRSAFAPNGPIRPMPVDAPALRAYQRNRRSP
ncbi:MAG: hypothetical protein RMJ43_04930 [Chloroherpetonaceae bacterium]|nr:hypothetical protein [Chthonomonadaceae bacterium]MDW8207159.1 hypothetical protein [Chloroherpetonaceae bacterium]